LAAARSLKIKSVGIEIDTEYFEIAKRAVPKLSDLDIDMFSDMSMNEADSDKMKIQERLVSN
jgi:DNA modification methylase